VGASPPTNLRFALDLRLVPGEGRKNASLLIHASSFRVDARGGCKTTREGL
jgi:hypothetical protein